MIGWVILAVVIVLALVVWLRLSRRSSDSAEDVRLQDPTGRIHEPYGDFEKPSNEGDLL